MARTFRLQTLAVLCALGCVWLGCNRVESPPVAVAPTPTPDAPPQNDRVEVAVPPPPARAEEQVSKIAPETKPSADSLPSCAAGCEAGCMPGDTSAAVATGSHKQIGVLKPMHEGMPIELNTFCVTSQGDILACVGGDADQRATPDPENPGQYKVVPTATKRLIQVYGPNHKLKNEIALSFKPTAINTTPDGKSFYVAGQGRIAHVMLNGEIIREAATPNIGDPERFKEKALAAQKRDMERRTKDSIDEAAEHQKRIDELEAIAEEERSDEQNAQLEAARVQKEGFEQNIKLLEAEMNPENLERLLRERMVVTAVAATEKDVFVCCKTLKGHGYEIWRTTLDLDETEAQCVVDGVSGCCGQLDIQAEGDHLYVAENGRFQVGIYDRDGERLNGFGKRDRKVVEGFGSCCNPMNIRVFPDGSVLTAESSIGNLKRFDKDGKFVAYIGKAKVSGGCKHVACGFDAERNRYYFMNVDQQHICILGAASEAGEETQDERLAREAKEGLAKKLEGRWKVVGPNQDESPETPARDLPRGAPMGTERAYEFNASGALKIRGGMLEQFGRSGLEWAPVKQVDDTLHCDILLEGVAHWNFTVKFESDDVAFIGLNLGSPSPGGPAKVYRDGSPEPELTTVEQKTASDWLSKALQLLSSGAPAKKAEPPTVVEPETELSDEDAPFGE